MSTEAPAMMPALPKPWSVGPITRTDIVRYQGASGDMNPIHHDEPWARASGLPMPLGIGMLQAGLIGTYLSDWLGPDNVRRFRIRFVEQVWPGDTLTMTCEKVEPIDIDGAPGLQVEAACTREGGGRAVTVWASYLLPSQESA
ncbi:acyl dehydratase [Branchiibius hedensis]|uniref:Acyl dehydratase n=1 Tax=Branchiibius hedensis TaxID=672460 RepID=A0A2Y8ZX25_9MICO|nr:MaoC/PaaZ C-terminal domain-containing protein [Branchiibius hedensis]PWJ27037.1 acyl dehydratase [Branchiibius hedensis]SSA35848.1 Acyl dehydratase [Branchiibius hedensis]